MASMLLSIEKLFLAWKNYSLYQEFKVKLRTYADVPSYMCGNQNLHLSLVSKALFLVLNGDSLS